MKNKKTKKPPKVANSRTYNGNHLKWISAAIKLPPFGKRVLLWRTTYSENGEVILAYRSKYPHQFSRYNKVLKQTGHWTNHDKSCVGGWSVSDKDFWAVINLPDESPLNEPIGLLNKLKKFILKFHK